jgi:hypothetical protein
MLGLLPLCCEISPSSNEVNILDLSVRVLQWNELVGFNALRRLPHLGEREARREGAVKVSGWGGGS